MQNNLTVQSITAHEQPNYRLKSKVINHMRSGFSLGSAVHIEL